MCEYAITPVGVINDKISGCFPCPASYLRDVHQTASFQEPPPSPSTSITEKSPAARRCTQSLVPGYEIALRPLYYFSKIGCGRGVPHPMVHAVCRAMLNVRIFTSARAHAMHVEDTDRRTITDSMYGQGGWQQRCCRFNQTPEQAAEVEYTTDKQHGVFLSEREGGSEKDYF